MSDGVAMRALPCECGHPESDHRWDSQRIPGLSTAAACAWRARKKPVDDSSYVDFDECRCRQYSPSLAEATERSEAPKEPVVDAPLRAAPRDEQDLVTDAMVDAAVAAYTTLPMQDGREAIKAALVAALSVSLAKPSGAQRAKAARGRAVAARRRASGVDHPCARAGRGPMSALQIRFGLLEKWMQRYAYGVCRHLAGDNAECRDGCKHKICCARTVLRFFELLPAGIATKQEAASLVLLANHLRTCFGDPGLVR